MKKSEILSIIANYFYHCNVDSGLAEHKSKQLFNDLERKGYIIPPFHFCANDSYVTPKEISEYKEISEIYDGCFEWEEEDNEAL